MITALMAMIFLGRKQYIHHWLSLLTIVVGIAVVGYVSYAQPKNNSQTEDSEFSLFGVILIFLAMCFMGGMQVVEEKFMSGIELDPYYLVGMEGLWGLLLFAFLLPAMQKFECQGQLCPNGHLENTLAAYQELRENKNAQFYSLCNIISVAGFNVCGVMVTKYASAAQRSTIDACRTFTIWMFMLARGHEKFLIGELCGFVLLVLGTLIYNEIIELPFEALSKNTRRNQALAQKQAENEKQNVAKDTDGSESTRGDDENAPLMQNI